MVCSTRKGGRGVKNTENRPTDRPTDQPIDQITDRPTNQLTKWSTDRQADRSRLKARLCSPIDDPIDPISQEEKERKKLAAKLPKVEAELEEQILLWEKENGRQFQVCGVRYIEYVQTQRDNHEIEKQMVSLVTQYCCVTQRKHDSPHVV